MGFCRKPGIWEERDLDWRSISPQPQARARPTRPSCRLPCVGMPRLSAGGKGVSSPFSCSGDWSRLPACRSRSLFTGLRSGTGVPDEALFQRGQDSVPDAGDAELFVSLVQHNPAPTAAAGCHQGLVLTAAHRCMGWPMSEDQENGLHECRGSVTLT